VIATKTDNQAIAPNHFDAKLWIVHRQSDKGRIDFAVDKFLFQLSHIAMRWKNRTIGHKLFMHLAASVEKPWVD
jgi:hypothetical protein